MSAKIEETNEQIKNEIESFLTEKGFRQIKIALTEDFGRQSDFVTGYGSEATEYPEATIKTSTLIVEAKKRS